MARESATDLDRDILSASLPSLSILIDILRLLPPLHYRHRLPSNELSAGVVVRTNKMVGAGELTTAALSQGECWEYAAGARSTAPSTTSRSGGRRRSSLDPESRAQTSPLDV